jgi:predicted ATP-dependent endonuclease of OLD family
LAVTDADEWAGEGGRMRLKLENISMIRYADIKLDGLTIIAGENDTGKSTTGKLIFSLIKAFNRYEQDLNESKTDRLLELAEKNYFQLRKSYNFEEQVEIKEWFHPRAFMRELKKNQENPIEFFDDSIHLLEKIDATESINILHFMQKLYLEDENKDLVIKRALTKALVSEFYFELTPKSNTNLISHVSLSEGVNKIFDISIRNNEVETLALHDDLSLNDVTYIETPIFLQMYDLIRSTSNLFEMLEDKNKLSRPTIALHIKDLISKLENAQYSQQSSLFDNDKLNDLLTDISTVVNGSGFSFDKQQRDFYFNKNNGTKFKSVNTATGLKAFGMIQLLIQANVLNERSLLIIDEPEIHLHPKWQVEYAKLIVMLVKHDIPILVTSHSPEIIQALTVFGEQFGIKDRIAYYLTESDGVFANITDVTDDINKIFFKLAEPLHNLVWD